jgi:hypothetical protein
MTCYILFDKLYYKVPVIVAHSPLAGLAAVLFMAGTVFIATGLIGEMISRVYFESTGRKIYSVKNIHTRQTLGPE